MNTKAKTSANTKAKTSAHAPPATATSKPKNGNDGAGATDVSSPLKLHTRLWDELKVGSLVIAPAKNVKADGYWAAIVTSISLDGKKLTVRWRDFSDQPLLTVNRASVALLLHG